MQDGRAPRIKNRAPAAVQITAEQLLREAQERQETAFRAPKQRVEDFEELHEYRGRKRKEFEERIRRSRGSLKEWQQYASWEASQGEYDRSRSVYERALDVDARSVPLWMSYTEMELKARNVQHARNLFDRAVTLLPRVDSLWYKYVYLEELLQNIPGARQVFERWMKWEPDDKAWQAYIKLEERYQELDRASAIYERWIAVRPEPRVWVKWGKFEEDRGRLDKAREVFQTALEFFGDDEEQVEKAQAVFGAFAKMETRLKEYERARVIYKFALSKLPRSKSSALYNAYTKFEKQHGTRSTLESTVLGKRRIQYEEELSHDGRNYDVWFDFARLEEEALKTLREEGESGEEEAVERVREVYERAVANVPPGGEKRHWRRYIFLWLDYALFEELETKDFSRARQIYRTALTLVPHKQFTFAKLWLMAAKFEIRRMDVVAARKVLGTAIGMCPKERLFKGYIELESNLREYDRVRELYQKYLQYDSSNSPAWINFATLEDQLGDEPRARAIFELAVAQPQLSMPEIIWKAYIDFELTTEIPGSRERARELYERLVERSGHVKVWVSFALFEAEDIVGAEDDEEEDAEPQVDKGDVGRARAVFERGYRDLRGRDESEFKSADDKSEARRTLLEEWKIFEEKQGDAQALAKVEGMLPRRVTKSRMVGDTGDMEEYFAYIFPDDERDSNPASFKFLQMAHAWKMAQARGGGGGGAGQIGFGSVPEESSSRKTVQDEDGDTAMRDGNPEDDDDLQSSGGED